MLKNGLVLALQENAFWVVKAVQTIPINDGNLQADIQKICSKIESKAQALNQCKDFKKSTNALLTDLNNLFAFASMVSSHNNNSLRIFYGHTLNAKQLSDWLAVHAAEDRIVMNKKK